MRDAGSLRAPPPPGGLSREICSSCQRKQETGAFILKIVSQGRARQCPGAELKTRCDVDTQTQKAHVIAFEAHPLGGVA